MTERVTIGGLQIAKVLYDFVNNEALPGTGVDADAFWAGADKIVDELAPKNRALLAKRDDLQAQIDTWHRDRAGAPHDAAAYKAFLEEIGYLVPVPAPFQVDTAGVDTEITSTPGPQLVVPILNARFALNASNARWGSLYDALYGTDAISEEGGAEKTGGYNKVRGDKVIAWARDFLDKAAPLQSGSHADSTNYSIDGTELKVTLSDGTVTGLADATSSSATSATRTPPPRCCCATTACTSRSRSTPPPPSEAPTPPESRTSSSNPPSPRSWTSRTPSPQSTPTTRPSDTATGSA